MPPATPSFAPLVLVVEDEADIADILQVYLQRDGMRARLEADGAQALRAFRETPPDLVLLDIHLPGMDGFDVLKTLRAESDVPVIMVSARADDVDKLLALRMGADDYVVKPYSPAEVVARVKAVLRRTSAMPARASAADAPAVIRAGQLEIDQEAHVVRSRRENGDYETLPLTLTEFRLLTCLATHPRRVFSRSYLVETCIPESDATDRVIDSHLSKLRRKLDTAGHGELIETVRGIGYRLWPER